MIHPWISRINGAGNIAEEVYTFVGMGPGGTAAPPPLPSLYSIDWLIDCLTMLLLRDNPRHRVG